MAALLRRCYRSIAFYTVTALTVLYSLLWLYNFTILGKEFFHLFLMAEQTLKRCFRFHMSRCLTALDRTALSLGNVLEAALYTLFTVSEYTRITEAVLSKIQLINDIFDSLVVIPRCAEHRTLGSLPHMDDDSAVADLQQHLRAFGTDNGEISKLFHLIALL